MRLMEPFAPLAARAVRVSHRMTEMGKILCAHTVHGTRSAREREGRVL